MLATSKLSMQYQKNTEKTSLSLSKVSNQMISLDAPVKGRILHYLNAYINLQDKQIQGVYFKTMAQQFVYSVCSGEVVFSEHVKGLGLLIIIEDEEGHLILYGNNALLYKIKGDHVKHKELIAETGRSLNGLGAYFDVYQKGKKINVKKILTV